MVRVAQRWPSPGRCDLEREIQRQIDAPEIARRIPRGAPVAIGVGSRGIAEIDRIAAAVVAAVRRHGADPFVFPAMGSHGGATAEGQAEVLAALGVTHARVGAPIVAPMDVVELGQLRDGSGVFWDRRAHAAQAVIVIGRVKPHTLVPARDIDVLVGEEIGKNISGDGMDPNITGRYLVPDITGGPAIRRIAVLDLTDETHGNAIGVGTADFIPERVVNKLDLGPTYMNAITAAITESVRLPMILATDRDVLGTAVLTTQRPTPGAERVVYIRNTLALGEVAVSTALVPALEPHARVASQPFALEFTGDGALVPLLAPAAVGGRPGWGDF